MSPPRASLNVTSEPMSIGRDQRRYHGNHRGDTAGPSQHRNEDRRRCIPQTIIDGRLLENEDGSLYSPPHSDEELLLSREFKWKASKPRRDSDSESPLAQTRATVPGGKESNPRPEGRVRRNKFGLLEFLGKKAKTWIPAVYHCMIRDKLINKARTCEADAYKHPRARGKHILDVTAFLAAQKDWDLEPANGWKAPGLALLHMFELNHEKPSYEVSWMYDEGCVVLDLINRPVKDYKNIPLTFSTKVEDVLMEAIRRGDPRITMQDFAARLLVYPSQAPKQRLTGYSPEKSDRDKSISPNALNMRISRFRDENGITALNVRKNTKKLNQLKTDAGRDANLTRESGNVPKFEPTDTRRFIAWKPQDGQNQAKEEVWAPANFQKEGETKSASPECGKNKRAQSALESDHPNKRQKVREHAPSVIVTTQDSYPVPMYENAFLDPLLHLDFPHHSSGPSSSSFLVHDSIQNRQTPSIGIDIFTKPTPVPARAISDSQWIAPMAPHYSSLWIPNVESTSQSPYYYLHGQTWPFDDAEEDVFGTGRGTDIMASKTYPMEIPAPVEVDFRNVPPQTEEDMHDIQNALLLTQAHSLFHVGSKCVPTSRHQSYFYQVQEVLNNFAVQWTLSRKPLPMPDLVTCREPWSNGFKDWAPLTGEDEVFVNACFDL